MSRSHKVSSRSSVDNTSSGTIDALRQVRVGRESRPILECMPLSRNPDDTSSQTSNVRETFMCHIQDICDPRSAPRESEVQQRHISESSLVAAPSVHEVRNHGYDPGISCFASVITPVTGLISYYNNLVGVVEFKMRRKNKTVTLQWEPFGGAVSSNGIAYLTVAQSISNTPPYKIAFPILIEYKGIGTTGVLIIDPHLKTGHIRIYFHSDTNIADTVMGDGFYVYGSCVTWIVE